ncbi:hypothetical protein BH80429_00400 [Bartonella henselae]|nr:hypothetical protein BH80429_00400 [Bartonella henselae]
MPLVPAAAIKSNVVELLPDTKSFLLADTPILSLPTAALEFTGETLDKTVKNVKIIGNDLTTSN